MRSPSLALTWEFLRGGSSALALNVGVLFVPVLFYFMLHQSGVLELIREHPTFRMLQVAFSCFLIPTIVMGAVHATGEVRRRFTLPVSAAQLAIWPLLQGLLASSLMYVSAAVLLNRVFAADWPLSRPLAVTAGVYVWCQTLVWALRLPQRLRTALAGLAATIAVCAIIWLNLFDPSTVRLANWSRFSVWEGVFFAAAILAAFPIAVLVVRLGRSRRSLDFTAIVRWFGGCFDVVLLRPREHHSPRAAQAWFEWRQKGLPFPVGVGALATVFVLFCACGVCDARTALSGWFMVSVVLTELCLAFGFYMGHVGSAAQMETFRATRPLSDTALANSILWNAAASLLAMWSVWLAVLLVGLDALLFAGHGDALWNVLQLSHRGPTGVCQAAMVVVLVLAGSWTLMSWAAVMVLACVGVLRSTLFTAGFALILVVPLGAQLFLPPDWARIVLTLNAATVLVLGAVAMVAATVGARWLGLVGRRAFLTLAALPLAVWPIALWTLWTGTEVPVTVEASLIVLVACGLPFFPFSAAPIALQWNRHR